MFENGFNYSEFEREGRKYRTKQRMKFTSPLVYYWQQTRNRGACSYILEIYRLSRIPIIGAIEFIINGYVHQAAENTLIE